MFDYMQTLDHIFRIFECLSSKLVSKQIQAINKPFSGKFNSLFIYVDEMAKFSVSS